jgi:hypothetical protein
MGSGVARNSQFRKKRLSENLPEVEKNWPMNSGGFFGKNPKGTPIVSDIECDDPIGEAQQFYDKIANGGETQSIYDKYGNYKGELTTMADGSIVVLRIITSTVGKPAVSINIDNSNEKEKLGGLVSHKIHFKLKGNK